MKIFRTVTVILLLLWMCLIFSLSAENADTSSDTSTGFIITAVKIFYPDFNNLTEAEQLSFIAPYHIWVRKAAHFTLYAVLGALSFFTLITYTKIPLKLRLLFSAAICLVYAASDEIHQLFIPGRSGEVRDVLIDFCGSAFAILILSLFLKVKRFKKYS